MEIKTTFIVLRLIGWIQILIGAVWIWGPSAVLVVLGIMLIISEPIRINQEKDDV